MAHQDFGNDPARVELIERVATSDPMIHAVGQAMLDELQSGGVAGDLYLGSLVQVLAVHLLRNYTAFPPKPPPEGVSQLSNFHFKRVCDYINEQLGHSHTLTELAALVNLSPYYFTRKFKQNIGLSPYQYIILCRVRRAKELLLDGEHTIAEIAEQVGFADQSHLTRHFKRVFGVPP